MIEFLHILCPVDFSDRARTAVGYAATLADHFRARLDVVAVNADADGEPVTVARLEGFVAPIADRFKTLNPALSFTIDFGVPGDAIIRQAEEDRADLIVISTHGAGAATAAYGSTTLHVMRHAAVPLLVIPPALHALPQPAIETLIGRDNRVLAPVDFHHRAIHDVRIAAGIAQAFDIDLLLLHVLSQDTVRNGEEANAMLAELAADVNTRVRVDAVLALGNPAAEISRVAIDHNAGVIVMGLRGDGRAIGSLPGSIAYEVVRQAPALVLALPEGRGWISRPKPTSAPESRCAECRG